MISSIARLSLTATAALFAALSPARGQLANSEAVGFITLPINGAAAGGQTALSFRSLGVARPIEFRGAATSDVTPGSSQITCTTASWTADRFNGTNGKYYLEIVGPAGTPGAGTMYDIVTTNALTHTLTLDQSLSNAVTGKPSFRIRKHWTLGSVFGLANEGGLTGGFATTADVVMVYSGGLYTRYYYSLAAGQIGWRKGTDTATDQSGTVLYPDDGLLISRQDTSATQVVLKGAVKTGQTSFPVLAGLNILGNPYAAPMTLAASNLYLGDGATGLTAGFATTADLVLIYNGTRYETYYYSAGGTPGVGWRKVAGDGSDQGATQIPVGTAFIVQRKNGGAFNWVIPQFPPTL